MEPFALNSGNLEKQEYQRLCENVMEKQQIVRELSKEFNAKYLELRNMESILGMPTNDKHVTMLLNLNQGEKIIWSKFSKNMKSCISRAAKEDFNVKLNELKSIFENQKIHQRTPNRVSHRRVDKIRGKFVYKIDGKFIKSNLFEFKIQTQGGTYIKELISGDDGRTSPSFSEVFNFPLVCKELDVLEITI